MLSDKYLKILRQKAKDIHILNGWTLISYEIKNYLDKYGILCEIASWKDDSRFIITLQEGLDFELDSNEKLGD